MSEKHTPTPWRVFTSKDGRYLGVGEETGDGILANGYGMWRDGDEAIANAALIVRAVNSHAELVAALESAVDLLEQARREANYDLDPYETDESKTTIGKFRSVLARAKVQP
jgi:hypothetical protein